jgi:hypothetical protein
VVAIRRDFAECIRFMGVESSANKETGAICRSRLEILSTYTSLVLKDYEDVFVQCS